MRESDEITLFHNKLAKALYDLLPEAFQDEDMASNTERQAKKLIAIIDDLGYQIVTKKEKDN